MGPRADPEGMAGMGTDIDGAAAGTVLTCPVGADAWAAASA